MCLLATVAICGVVILCAMYLWRSHRFWREAVRHTVPVAVAQELNHQGVRTAKAALLGRTCTLTSNLRTIVKLLEHSNFTQRPAVNAHLDILGMYHHGVVWNNNYHSWLSQRRQMLKLQGAGLPELILQCVKHREAYRGYHTIHCGVDFLHELRCITCQIILERAAISYNATEIDDIVHLIVDYFKAWEYFLLRPLFGILFMSCLVSPVNIFTKFCQRVERFCNRRYRRHWLAATALRKCAAGLVDRTQDSCGSREAEQYVLELLIAGTDTTSVTMFNVLHYLACNKDAQDAVYQEILQTDEQDSLYAATSFTSKELQQAYPLLFGYTCEVMRLRPVGPIILRTADSNIKASDAGLPYDIVQGEHVVCHVAAAGLDEHVYPNPHEVNPTRWSSPGLPVLGFGFGPKRCAGDNIAWQEMGTILPFLLRRYEFGKGALCPDFFGTKRLWSVAYQPNEKVDLTIAPRVPEPGMT